MPYEVINESADSEGGSFVVRNKATGKIYGRHKTKKEAMAHMQAMYANTKDEAGKAEDFSGSVDALQASVAVHLTAIEAYQLAASCSHHRWGMKRMSERWKDEVDGERKDLKQLLKRLEKLDAAPSAIHEPADPPRDDVEALLSYLLGLEEKAAKVERAGILTARDSGDEGTAAVFVRNLKHSEDGTRHLTNQMRQMKAMGKDAWLSLQVDTEQLT